MSVRTCKRNHPYTGRNAIPRADGRRECRTCRDYARQARSRGLGGFVDAAPVAEKLRRLRRQGMTAADIAGVSGLSLRQVQDLILGRYGKVHAATARVVAAIRYNPSPMGQRNPVGARRRIGALLLNGWTIAELAERAGVSPQPLYFIETQRQRFVLQSTFEAVCRVFDELWDVRPPDSVPSYVRSRTRNRALAKGHVPALAWDDIDDPDELPQHQAVAAPDLVDEVAVMERKPSNRAEVDAVIEAMLRRGFSDNRVSLELGRGAHVVARVRRRMEAEAEEAAA